MEFLIVGVLCFFPFSRLSPWFAKANTEGKASVRNRSCCGNKTVHGNFPCSVRFWRLFWPTSPYCLSPEMGPTSFTYNLLSNKFWLASYCYAQLRSSLNLKLFICYGDISDFRWGICYFVAIWHSYVLLELPALRLNIVSSWWNTCTYRIWYLSSLTLLAHTLLYSSRLSIKLYRLLSPVLFIYLWCELQLFIHDALLRTLICYKTPAYVLKSCTWIIISIFVKVYHGEWLSVIDNHV
jgi:hypothetical protein